MKDSNFIKLYFSQPIWDNQKYSNLYWDRINKILLDLIKLNNKNLDNWKKFEKLDEALLLLKDCYNAPETFVENGYLTSIT